MSERNEKMAALLAAHAPAVRDASFQLAVQEKIAQRRFRHGILRTITLTMAATLLLALVVPAIDPALQQAIAGNSLMAALVVLASIALPWWATRRA